MPTTTQACRTMSWNANALLQAHFVKSALNARIFIEIMARSGIVALQEAHGSSANFKAKFPHLCGSHWHAPPPPLPLECRVRRRPVDV